MEAVQFRIARPTNNLQNIIKFYHEVLGLEFLGKFENHLGYSGAMFGMPDIRRHLEFTQYSQLPTIPHTVAPYGASFRVFQSQQVGLVGDI